MASRSGSSRIRGFAAVVALVLLPGCQWVGLRSPWEPSIGPDIYRRAESQRARRLEQEVERLRADLRQAEEALVAAESGLLGTHGRADAVSSLAEVQIQVERAAREAPWRRAEIAEAKAKLGEGDRLIQQGHFGAALFFVYRAQRIADHLQGEAQQVAATLGARFIRGRHVNLRAGPSTDDPVLTVLTAGTPVFPERRRNGWMLVRTPSGPVGWVHADLVDSSSPASPAR
ncbi:MAG: SH3 domain-containing protein [Proteobacteria bacterium]|nr:SH3 domain-containing protein [Pseudomonadota bacterium]